MRDPRTLHPGRSRPVAVLLPFLAAIAAGAGCATGDAEREVRPDGPVVRAVRSDAAPRLDGSAEDAAWAAAPATEVDVTGPAGGPLSCTVQAVVHGDTLHVLVGWDDPTEDREHKPWVASSEGLVAGPEREDVLALAFPIRGPFTADMLSPVEAVWDVWQWKAKRTDPAGHAMDKSHLYSFSDPGGKRHAHTYPDGRVLYMARPEDAGTSATVTLPKGGAPGPQYRAQAPSGSAADVRARGAWRDGRWTVELARRLSTGQPDDAELEAGSAIPFAVAVFDAAEDEDHAASEVLTLVVD